MKGWPRAWSYSISVHIVLAVVVGILYVYHHTEYLPKAEGIRVHIGGVAGTGHGGAIKSNASSQEQDGADDQKEARRKKLLQSAMSAIEEQRLSPPKEDFVEKVTQKDAPIGKEASDGSKRQASAPSSGEGKANSGMGRDTGGNGQGSGNGSNPLAEAGFDSNGDGTYTAKSAEGLNYTIINQVEASYPQAAKDANYTRTVVVEARFLVDTQGNVERVSILNSPPNLGFKEAAINALYQWKFEPITYKGYPIKVYFRKSIRFEPN